MSELRLVVGRSDRRMWFIGHNALSDFDNLAIRGGLPADLRCEVNSSLWELGFDAMLYRFPRVA